MPRNIFVISAPPFDKIKTFEKHTHMFMQQHVKNYFATKINDGLLQYNLLKKLTNFNIKYQYRILYKNS